MNKLNMQIAFTLPRNDLWLPNRKISKIYSLTKLSKFFGKETASHFHPLIKKTLLCSNYEFWYSNYSQMFSVVLNSIFFNIFLGCYSMTNSEEIKICIRQILLMNIPNLISLLSFISMFTKKNNHIQSEMNHYLNYFITNSPHLQRIKGDKEGDSYSIIFDRNFQLSIAHKITKRTKAKTLHDNNTPRDNQYFEYVINIPNSSFRSYHYEVLLGTNEKDIIKALMVYLLKKDLKWKKEKLHFLFTLLFWLLLLYFQKDSVSFLVTVPYCIVLIILYYMFEFKNFHLNKTLLKKFISEINSEIIANGYYIDMSDYLISLFAIKRNCLFNLQDAQKEVELIKRF